MHLSTATYHFAACAGKVDNLINPRCQATGPGSFDPQEATDAALGQGWVDAGKAYCPAHRDQAPTEASGADGAPKPRRSRKRPEATAPYVNENTL